MTAIRRPMGAGMPLRGDRIHRYVNAFCPLCHEEQPDRPLAQVQRLSGWLVERGDRMWLERGCATHGLVRTLYDESPEILRYLEQWTAPTKVHEPDLRGNWKPVPAAYEDGLPELQTQHTCILLEDLLDHCNLKCPTCFAESAPARAGVAPIEAILANIDARLARENGRLDVLMLSGGEPTLHPDFARIIEEVVARPIVRIMVNTNGLTVARDDALLALLTRHRERVEVYLQYDGPSAQASIHHRGADLTRFKEAAIARLSEAGIFTTLVMTAALGVNDDQLGAVIDRALATPYIGGVSLQPVFGSGRSVAGGIDPLDRLTHTGVLARLGPQTDGRVTWQDLTALPCSHPHCCSVGYLLRDDAGVWRSLTSLVGHDRLKEWLDLDPDLLANRIADDSIPEALRGAVKQSLLDLLSEQSSLSHPDIGGIWRDICSACDLGIGTLTTLATSRLPGQAGKLRRLLGERVVRVTVKPFMDMDTMIEERLTQCCVHVGSVAAPRSIDDDSAKASAASCESSDESPDQPSAKSPSGPGPRHQCVPFCAIQAWQPLSQRRLSTATGEPLSRSTP